MNFVSKTKSLYSKRGILYSKTRDFALKTRNCVFNSRYCALKMMKFAGLRSRRCRYVFHYSQNDFILHILRIHSENSDKMTISFSKHKQKQLLVDRWLINSATGPAITVSKYDELLIQKREIMCSKRGILYSK